MKKKTFVPSAGVVSGITMTMNGQPLFHVPSGSEALLTVDARGGVSFTVKTADVAPEVLERLRGLGVIAPEEVLDDE